MRPGIRLIVLALMSAVVCVSAIPPIDLPETSYNEVDTPINQAPPVVSGPKFVRPVIETVILPRNADVAGYGSKFHWPAGASFDVPVRHDSHSMQDLLCTLLI